MKHLEMNEVIELAENLDWGNPLENPEDIKDSLRTNWEERIDEESVEAVYSEMVRIWNDKQPDDFRRKSTWFYDGTGRETLFEADGISVFVEDGYIHLVTDADDITMTDTAENRTGAINDAKRTIEAWKD